MKNISQKNEKGDNIGRDKYVFNIGSTKIKVWHIISFVLLMLVVIYTRFFLSLLYFVIIKHFFESLILFSFLYFFPGKKKNKLYRLFVLIPIALIIFIYLDISSTGKATYGINFLGCFQVNENGYLKEDDYTDNLTNLFSASLIEKSKQHVSFTSKNYDLNIIEIPYFLTSLLGVNGINKMMSMRQNDYHTLDFYYVIKENQIVLNILPNLDVYSLGIHIKWMASEISKLSTCLQIDNFNNLSSSLLIAAFGQSCLHSIYLEDSNFALAYSIVTDSEKLTREVEKYPKMCFSNNSFSKLINLQNANLYRERFRIAIHQENYNQAIKFFCTAIEYSTIFPYSSYEKFKVEYVRSYYKNIGQSAIELLGSDPSLTENLYTDDVADDIGFLIDDYQLLPQEYMPILFRSLSKNKKPSDSIYWLLMSQVTKWLSPTDSNEQMLKLNPNQLKKSIEFLDSSLVVDSNFRFAKSLKELYLLMSQYSDSTLTKELNFENMNSEHSEFFNQD